MSIEEMLAMIKSPPEDGLPDTIYDDITAAYNEVNERATTGDSKIAELTAVNETLVKQVQELKAHNYDLLTAVNSDDTDDSTDDVDEPDDDNSDPFEYEDI